MQLKNREEMRALCDALAGMKTADDIELFLEDLCTIQEIMSLSQRFYVARLLSNGTNYTEINQKTGVSSATISRVNRCINYGAGGYQIALDLIKDENDDN